MRPEFLCIGAVKAGTTWLHEALDGHPQVWMPPIKELRYFDQPEHDLPARLLGRDRKRYEYWRHRLRDAVRELPGLARDGTLRWHLRYFLGRRSPAWYESLFAPAGDRVSGDVTPLYATLPAARIDAIADRFPHLRIVYLLRDPVERTWSHVIMRCKGLPEVDWDVSRLTPQIVARTFWSRDVDDEWLWATGRYAENLERWEDAFGRDRVLVGFHDDLVRDPAGLLRSVTDFLGIDPPHDVPSGPRNAEPVRFPLPPDVEREMASRFVDDLDRLVRRFDDPVRRWLGRARRTAA